MIMYTVYYDLYCNDIMVLILRITLNKAVGYCVQLTIMFCHLEILLTNSSTCEMKTGCHVAKYTCKTISAAAS